MYSPSNVFERNLRTREVFPTPGSPARQTLNVTSGRAGRSEAPDRIARSGPSLGPIRFRSDYHACELGDRRIVLTRLSRKARRRVSTSATLSRNPSHRERVDPCASRRVARKPVIESGRLRGRSPRSEEHTSELQSPY